MNQVQSLGEPESLSPSVRSSVPSLDVGVEQGGRLYAVLLTYHRLDALRDTLRAISSQSRPPDCILIVDNGATPAVEKLANDHNAEYLAPGENLGPAGGFALGMKHILERATHRDWLVTLGDDGPPRTEDRFEKLWAFAEKCVGFHDRVAAVGSNGALYDRESGRFIRVPDSQPNGPVSVDYLAGSQFHRCQALRELGPYRADFFFGFEEAEYGLRARSAGWSLFADGDIWFSDRKEAGRLKLQRARSATNTAAWRRYYSARNITAIARDFGAGSSAAMRVAIRTGLGGALALLRSRRPLAEVFSPIRGSIDGLRGNLGRTINPRSANKLN